MTSPKYFFYNHIYWTKCRYPHPSKAHLEALYYLSTRLGVKVITALISGFQGEKNTTEKKHLYFIDI